MRRLIALFITIVGMTIPISSQANEPDYQTTIDFLIKHGSGWENGKMLKVTEQSNCVIQIALTNVKVIKTGTFSSKLDTNRPLKTTTLTLPINGLMAEKLLNANRMRDRLEFQTANGFSINEHVVFHEKPTGMVFLNKAIIKKLNGKSIPAGFEDSGEIKNTYWMLPGEANTERRNFKPIYKAFKHLISLCGGVEETDYGVFGEENEEAFIE